MNYRQKYLSACLLGIAALLIGASPAFAAKAKVPSLGAASSFAALAGGPATGAVTCTDSATPNTITDVTGDVGVVFPGTFVNTGCTIVGTVNTNAVAAYADFLDAYAALAPQQGDGCTIISGNLAGQVLVPGVYCVAAASTTTGGTLTLNGAGIYIFKIGTGGSGYLVGTNFSVVLAGGATACDVYWWVAQYATLTDSNFQGTILAGADITVTRGTFNGDALAGGAGTTAIPTGAVTLTDATIAGCPGGTFNPPQQRCNQGVGNGTEGCDPGNSNQGNPFRSNDELLGGVPGTAGTPGNPGRKGGNK